MSAAEEQERLERMEISNKNRISNVIKIDEINSIINEALINFRRTNTRGIVASCEFFITSIDIAIKHRDDIQDTWVKSYRESLSKEVEKLQSNISDLKSIKNTISENFVIDDDKYALIVEDSNNFIKELNNIIDYNLKISESTFRRANEAINNDKFEELENNEEIDNNPKQEEMENSLQSSPILEPELNPTEIRVDSLEDLSNEVNEDIDKITKTANDLKETSQLLESKIDNQRADVDDEIKVTSVEEASKEYTPILEPIRQNDLNVYGKSVEQPKEEVNDLQASNQSLNAFLANAPVANEEVKNVDNDFIKVVKWESFGAPSVVEEGPVLSRAA